MKNSKRRNLNRNWHSETKNMKPEKAEDKGFTQGTAKSQKYDKKE